MTDENDGGKPLQTVVIRLLTSALAGCEFTLTAARTLFLVADSEQLKQLAELDNHDEDKIYIPVASGGVNFELDLLPDAASSCRVILRELKEGKTTERVILSQQVMTVGALTLAMRYEDECWDKAILAYPPVVEKNIITQLKKSPQRWPLMIITTLVIIGLVMLCYYALDNQGAKISEVSALLGVAPGKYQLVVGNDKVIYVFAKDSADKDWAEQALVRTPIRGTVRLVNIQQEQQRLQYWLNQHWPELPFHRITLTSPARPVITLSRQRSELLSQKKLVTLLKGQLPYVEQVTVEQMDDAVLVSKAEEGLKKIALPYVKVAHTHSISLQIQGDIEDGELQQAKFFIQDFYRTWGDQYIRFSTELKKDWLKGKSFKYGERGYIKVSPSHWYFPKPLSTKE
ncbi:PrgH/EprH family type III secretion apparatus protein [Serratia quinivorans]|uniref:PrgH/EprH family type III secretion apparatus protein n=1 Tax=Serratia quinivorans TaxID=137545 RepID=UPI003982A325